MKAQFGTEWIISSSTIDPIDVLAADLDNDGDLDVLAASFGDNKITWYENDGNGNFGEQNVIFEDADDARSIFIADLDEDGDLDVLSASSLDDTISWYENDGNGNFGGQNVITQNAEGAHSVFSADLDGDGDMDVLSASLADDEIAWYENLGSTSIDKVSQPLFTSYPNPTESITNLQFKSNGRHSLSVYDSQGKRIMTRQINGNRLQLDLRTHGKGMYILKVEDEKMRVVVN